MGELTVTKRVAAPVERVFEVFVDLDRAAERISSIVRLETLTDGPVGVGTRFRETRIMFKREATEEMEFTAFEQGRGYTIECESCGCRYVTVTELEPEGSGTVVHWRLSYKPLTLFAKIMSPLGALMVGPLKKCLERDMDELKVAIETNDGATTEGLETAVG